MKNLPLNQARELLNKAEKTTDPHQKKALCEQALEIFDEILEDGQDDKIAIINNIRKSFARSLVNQISIMNMDDIDKAKFYFFNFILKFPKEIKDLMDEHSDFDEKITWLADQFGSFVE